MSTPQNNHHRGRLIDVTKAIAVGELGYALAFMVDENGESWPVLADLRQDAAQWVPGSNAEFRTVAPHELTGALPDAFTQFRCGARTASGRPCRKRTRGPGDRCQHHSQAADVTTRSSRHRSDVEAEPGLFELGPGADR